MPAPMSALIPACVRPSQLEFMALSDKTGRAVFADKVEQVVRTLNDHFPNQVGPCMCSC